MPGTFCLRSVAVALALLAPSVAAAQPAPALVPADAPIGSGAFPAVMEADPGLATHTIYHPAGSGSV